MPRLAGHYGRVVIELIVILEVTAAGTALLPSRPKPFDCASAPPRSARTRSRPSSTSRRKRSPRSSRPRRARASRSLSRTVSSKPADGVVDATPHRRDRRSGGRGRGGRPHPPWQGDGRTVFNFRHVVCAPFHPIGRNVAVGETWPPGEADPRGRSAASCLFVASTQHPAPFSSHGRVYKETGGCRWCRRRAARR